jgi:hypothetical protein
VAAELGAMGRGSPFGKIPVNEKKSKRTPAQSQRPSRLAKLRSAGCRAMCLRRQRAKRSIVAARKGRRQPRRTNSIVQPRIRRDPVHT